MKNILLLIHDDVGEEARFQAALDLARGLSGHLICLDVVQLPYLVGTDYLLVDAELAILEDSRDRESANGGRMRARLAMEDVTWDWCDATGDIAPLIETKAQLSDIIVLNTAFERGLPPDMRAMASGLVMHMRKPVLAVPAGLRRLDVGGHALIAWNGSPPAEAAMRAAVPLLSLAAGVTLVDVRQAGDDEPETAGDAAAYLSRHGIHAHIDRSVELDGTVAETLLRLCRERSPAYCVMGAYGHSRVREALFGGVTRQMLGESTVPLFIAH